MTSQNDSLKFGYHNIGQWTVPTLELANATIPTLSLNVHGLIVNSVTERKDRLQSWKVAVSSKVKSERGGKAWNPQAQYAIAISFSFFAPDHGYRRRRDGQCELDVENFVKPVVDGLAAGLFCDNDVEPSRIEHWNYDDSNFNTVLIHRLPDAAKPEDEGIAISVSSSLLGGR